MKPIKFFMFMALAAMSMTTACNSSADKADQANATESKLSAMSPEAQDLLNTYVQMFNSPGVKGEIESDNSISSFKADINGADLVLTVKLSDPTVLFGVMTEQDKKVFLDQFAQSFGSSFIQGLNGRKNPLAGYDSHFVVKLIDVKGEMVETSVPISGQTASAAPSKPVADTVPSDSITESPQ